MATEGRQDLRAFRAAEDLSEKQYHIVTLDSNGELELADTGGSGGYVLVDDPGEGEIGSVVTHGQTKVVLGDTVANMAFVTNDTNGKAVTAQDGDTVIGRVPIGGSSGQIVSIDIGASPTTSSI